MRGREVAEVVVKPCQVRQYSGLAILVVYVAADFERFVKACAAPVVISGLPAERAETAERADDFVSVFGAPEDRQRTPTLESVRAELAARE